MISHKAINSIDKQGIRFKLCAFRFQPKLGTLFVRKNPDRRGRHHRDRRLVHPGLRHRG